MMDVFKDESGGRKIESYGKNGWPEEGAEYHYTFADGHSATYTYDKIDFLSGHFRYTCTGSNLDPAIQPFMDKIVGSFIFNPVNGQPF